MDQFRVGAARAVGSTAVASGRSLRQRVLTLICVTGLVCAGGAASADDSAAMAGEAGLGLGSVFASLIYGPTKVLYAITGATVGGLAYVLSGGDSNVAQIVLTPSVRGDYVITPSHLRGDREIEFLGREPAYRPEPESVAQAPETPEASW